MTAGGEGAAAALYGWEGNRRSDVAPDCGTSIYGLGGVRSTPTYSTLLRGV